MPGDFGRDGKWVKAACSDNNVFICEVKETLFKRDCDTGWLLFGDKCYRYIVTIFLSLMFFKIFSDILIGQQVTRSLKHIVKILTVPI